MDIPEDTEIYSFKPFQFELVKADSSCDLPASRSGHRMVCTSNYLYVFGGYDPDNVNSILIRDMWMFNFSTRKWKLYAKNQRLPKALTSAAVVKSRQQMLVYGGTAVPFGLTSSNKLHCIKLNGEMNRYKTVEVVGDQPRALYGQASILHHGILYTIGGTNGLDYECDIHCINLRKRTKVWKELTSPELNNQYIPAGRYEHEVGYDGKNIYVLGGGTVDKALPLTDIPTFNIESRTWREVKSKGDSKSDPPFPQPRRSYGIVHMKNEKGPYIVLLGGFEDTELIYNDLWKLELSTLQWTRLGNSVLPRGLYFHSTAVTREGKLFAFGGIEEGGQSERNNNLHSTWLCIPKLHEISWEAILYYCRNREISKDLLRDLNIPERFIKRLD